MELLNRNHNEYRLYLIEKLLDKRSHEYFINNELFEVYEDFNSYLTKLDSKKIKGENKFVFITIQDFQRRLTELDKFTLFFKRIGYLYEDGQYCLEAGKVEPPLSNLHVHMLVKIKNSRNHKSKLRLEWLKLFDTDLNQKDYYKLQQHRDTAEMPPYDQWLQEKLDYFDQEKKGEHSNSIDLNIRGILGAPTGAL